MGGGLVTKGAANPTTKGEGNDGGTKAAMITHPQATEVTPTMGTVTTEEGTQEATPEEAVAADTAAVEIGPTKVDTLDTKDVNRVNRLACTTARRRGTVH